MGYCILTTRNHRAVVTLRHVWLTSSSRVSKAVFIGFVSFPEKTVIFSYNIKLNGLAKESVMCLRII